MMRDPLLSRYSVVMVDEAHERSVNTDVLLGSSSVRATARASCFTTLTVTLHVAGLLKKVQRRRGDLRIIISSATLDAEAFRSFFNEPHSGGMQTATIYSVKGRSYPVDVFYLEEPCADYVSKAVETVLAIHRTQPAGDILVFLTGQDEITRAIDLVEESGVGEVGGLTLLPLPLHASLPPRNQMQVFERSPGKMRKTIFATNVAETSVTIDGIVYVVDSLFVKVSVRMCAVSHGHHKLTNSRDGRLMQALETRLRL
jgi:ATP-dependent RNA helicase DDX35